MKKKIEFSFYLSKKKSYTMLNYYELFENLPEYIAFQILTYMPHKTADMIRKHWHNKYLGEFKINVENMILSEDDTGIPYTNFYGYYMYNESPQWGDNVAVESMRINNGIEWYLN
jgi:hypothetical protein